MADEYKRSKAELKEYFDGAKKSDTWLRVLSSSGFVIQGKISRVGENFAYFKPSLIGEDANKVRKEPCLRLEDKIESIIHLNSVHLIQPLTLDYVDSMLGKASEKKTGFGA